MLAEFVGAVRVVDRETLGALDELGADRKGLLAERAVLTPGNRALLRRSGQAYAGRGLGIGPG